MAAKDSRDDLLTDGTDETISVWLVSHSRIRIVNTIITSARHYRDRFSDAYRRLDVAFK